MASESIEEDTLILCILKGDSLETLDWTLHKGPYHETYISIGCQENISFRFY